MSTRKRKKRETKKQVVSRTERALKKRVKPVVVRRLVEVELWELSSEYSNVEKRKEAPRVYHEGGSPQFELGGEKDAYKTAAHILLSRGHHLWINSAGEDRRYFERVKERLARWLKWHDQIRKRYVG